MWLLILLIHTQKSTSSLVRLAFSFELSSFSYSSLTLGYIFLPFLTGFLLLVISSSSSSESSYLPFLFELIAILSININY